MATTTKATIPTTGNAAAAYPTPTATHDKMWSYILMASLAAIFVLFTVMSFSYGISGDEVDMNEYGKAILRYFSSFGADLGVFNMPKEYDRDGVIQYYGGFFDLICAVVNKFSPLAEYTTRHVLNAWAGFLAIFFATKITGKAMGKQAAVLCAWLMFLSPFFLGHAMNNPKDVPFATAYIAAIWCIIRLFGRIDKPKITDYIFCILSIGITINVRVGGILLIPYLGVFAAITYFTNRLVQGNEVNLKSYIKPLAIVAIGGYLAGSLFWPYGQKNPISNPLTALHEMSNFKVSLLQLWEGSKVPSNELPGNFLVKSLFITSNYAFVGGILLLAVFLWGMRKHRRAAVIYFAVFTGVFPIAYIIYSGANVYHGWRHVMFSFPSLAIAATAGWYGLSSLLEKRNFKYGMAIAAVLLLEPAAFIVSTYPNTICYFNAFAGGVKGAYCNYEMDYYYNSLKQDVEWFNKNELPKIKPGEKIIIGSNAAHLLLQYYKDVKNVEIKYVRFPERNQKEWDYSIFHIALIQEDEIKSGTWLPKSLLFKAEVKGCALSALSKRPSYDDLKGFAALKENKVDTALMYFDNHLKADPNNVEMLSLMGNIYHQLHQDNIAQQYNAKINTLMQAASEE